MAAQHAGEGAAVVGRLEPRLDPEQQVDDPVRLVPAPAGIELRPDPLPERDHPDVVADARAKLGDRYGRIERVLEPGTPSTWPAIARLASSSRISCWFFSSRNWFVIAATIARSHAS